MLAGLGRWSFQNRRVVAVLWLLIVVGASVASGAIGGSFDGTASTPQSESTEGFEIINEYFGGVGSGFTGNIVFKAEGGVDASAVRGPMEQLFAEIDAMEGVTVGSPYSAQGAQQISPAGPNAGQIAFATLDFDPTMNQLDAVEIGKHAVERFPEVGGLQVELGGAQIAEFEPPESELIGLAFAIVVLLVSFGSVLAMGLPIGVALAGVGTGIGLITLLSQITSVPDFATVLAAMIGLGVGIDYALFIVTRYREGTAEGMSPLDATVHAIDTAGRAVLFAGMTVVISLLGMLAMGLPFLNGLAIGASLTVAITMAASITLLPALLGFAQQRVEITRYRGLIAAALVAIALLGVGLGITPLLYAAPAALVVLIVGTFVPILKGIVPRREPKPTRETFWYRWSRVVQRNPWLAALIGTAILVMLSLPVLSLRLGFSDESNFGEETTTRQAYDLLVDGFGPGFNGPFLLAAELASPDDLGALASLTAQLQNLPGVASTSPPIPNDPSNPQAALVQVFPTTGPQDEATQQLLTELRTSAIPAAQANTNLDIKVTGQVPASVDFTEYLTKRLFLFFGVVLSLSFLLLMMVFRSLLVPLKAVIMNILSISAAYGIVVAIFQWGWGKDLVGIAGGAPIEPFLPMMLFAIVFGLSMDYEVFLLSRIKEEFDESGDAVESVADGLAATARVITAAAAIMVVVFGSFLLEENRIIKMFGTGLATAVFLDATLVRMLLVPATMELLGARNWWIPKWLDRVLPQINVEGKARPVTDSISPMA